MDATNKTPTGPLIAVVDDDASVRRSTERLLRSTGFRAEVFASAEEFLSSGRAEQITCLILDQRLPGMSGLELQRRLAEASIPIPTIFLSAHASENEERQALKSGAREFLQKPASKEVLLAAIRNAIKC